MIHRRTHPTHQENCLACKLLTVNISADALETKGKPVRAIEAKQKRWDRSGEAYRRLKKEGIQPPSIDHSPEIERRAETKEQAESGLLGVKKESFEKFGDMFGHRATEPARDR